MIKYNILLISTLVLLSLSCSTKKPDVLQYVDPLIGTDAHGHTYPGATQPFGMVQVGRNKGLFLELG